MPFFSWGMESSFKVSALSADALIEIGANCLNVTQVDKESVCKARLAFCPELNELQFVCKAWHAVFSNRKNIDYWFQLWFLHQKKSDVFKNELEMVGKMAHRFNVDIYKLVENLCSVQEYSDVTRWTIFFEQYYNNFVMCPYFFSQFLYCLCNKYNDTESLQKMYIGFLFDIEDKMRFLKTNHFIICATQAVFFLCTKLEKKDIEAKALYLASIYRKLNDDILEKEALEKEALLFKQCTDLLKQDFLLPEIIIIKAMKQFLPDYCLTFFNDERVKVLSPEKQLVFFYYKNCIFNEPLNQSKLNNNSFDDFSLTMQWILFKGSCLPGIKDWLKKKYSEEYCEFPDKVMLAKNHEFLHCLIVTFSISEFFSLIKDCKKWSMCFSLIDQVLNSIKNDCINNFVPLILKSSLDFDLLELIKTMTSRKEYFEQELQIALLQKEKKTLENDIETLKQKQIEKVQEYESDVNKRANAMFTQFALLQKEKKTLENDIETLKQKQIEKVQEYESDVNKKANAMFTQFKNRFAKHCFFGSLAFLVVCAFFYNASRSLHAILTS